VEILVLHPGALGDIILSLPALSLIKERLPNVRLTLAGNLDFIATVAVGIADRLVSLSAIPLHRLFGETPLPGEDLDFWGSFDRVLSWMGSGDPRFERRLKEINTASLVAGWKPGPDERRHVSRIFVDSLRPWFGDAGEPKPRLVRPCEGDWECARTWLEQNGADPERQTVALHPGAGNEAKRWPLDRFKEMACNLLRRAPVQLLLIEGPAEPGVGRDLMDGLPAGRCLLADNLPLGTLGALIRHCRLYIGNDSGISHLAAALGVTVVVLFGPTQPSHWAPLGEHIRILRNCEGCLACESRTGFAHRCMQNLTVSKVMGLLAQSSGETRVSETLGSGCKNPISGSQIIP
jgi:heptosyltransferase-3